MTKLVRLIKILMNETYRRARLDNTLSDMFPIRNGLKQGDALSPLLFTFELDYTIVRFKANQNGWKL
jgi:hypothetical protein